MMMPTRIPAGGGAAAVAVRVGVVSSAGGSGGVGIGVPPKTVEEELSLPILLAERVRKVAEEAETFKGDCLELGKAADRLAQSLRSAARLATSTAQPLYDRPVRRVAAECSKSLDRVLSLARRCRHRGGLLRRVVSIVGSADFRKASSLLDASLADTKWLNSVYSASLGTGGGGGEIVLSLPPIASTDPMLSWVWSYIAMVVHGGSAPSDRVDAANALATLAFDNYRNKKIIMEEGGVPPLLALLKDSSSLDAQLAAAAALTNLASCQLGVSVILNEFAAVSTIIHVLSDSPMSLQTRVAALVSRMAAQEPAAREEFARENAIRPLVTLLSFELPLEEPKPTPKKPTSIHSLVQINRELGTGTPPQRIDSGGGSSRGASSWSLDSHRRKEREREREPHEVKLQLKVACAEALWMLSKECVSNSRKITETRGLLCIAKIIEIEKGDLQFNCLMILMEISAAAELDSDLRRSAFKMNSPAAKLVVDQLLRVVQEVNTPVLQVPAIKSVGFLAQTFPARETRVIAPLVSQLNHWNSEVAAEAAIALGRFACPDNFLCVQHCKAIIEFDGVPPLMRLLRSSDRAQLHALILLCYLALHVGDHEALEHAKALTALELASRAPVAQNAALRELLPNAMYHLELYHAGTHPHGQSYVL